MKDLYHNVLATQVLDPQVATSTKTSSAIALQGYEAMTVLFAVGASGDTLSGSVYWTLSLQDSPDNSTYTAVDAAGVLNAAATAVVNSLSLDQATYSIGYIGGQPYVKALATATGTMTNGTPIGIVALLGSPDLAPVV